MISLDAAVTLATTLPALLVAHTVADHWVQTDNQAARKGLPGWPGRLACVCHVASYTATTAAVVGLLGALHLAALTALGFTLGQLVSAVTHYWADRRTTLARLADVVGLGAFYRRGEGLGRGSYALDQSWHYFWLLVAALIMAVTR